MDYKYAISFDDCETVDVDIVAAEIWNCIVPVIFRRMDGRVHNQGTAFCLLSLVSGDVLFATARHVIAELDGGEGIEPMVLLPRADDPANLMGIHVKQISLADTYSDVALIVVNINSAEHPVLPTQSLPISIEKPTIGEYTMALGYPHVGSAEQPRRVSYKLQASRGLIETIHERARDQTFSTFPTFETTGRYDPGMSGGPILNHEKTGAAVIGIVSHGFAGETPIGYGACMGGIAELKVGLTNDYGQVEEYTIAKLMEQGLLASPRVTVQLHRSEDGVLLSWLDPST